MSAPAKTIKDWQTTTASWWCPGCGDFGVLAALQRALANLGYANEEVTVVSGIGCSGKLSGYIHSYSYHSLHGRALPPAQAMKLVNKGQKVVVVGGDGDGYGIGAGHFVHAARRNIDITYIVMDNAVYGLTKGQVSPTGPIGFVTGTSPDGNHEAPINPLALYLASGGTFLAQGFAGDQKGLMSLFEAGIEHRGMSLINTFSPCVTFNKVHTYQWFREKLTTLTGETVDHDPSDKKQAMLRTLEDTIYTGLLYQEERPTPHETWGALKGVDSITGLDLNDVDYSSVLEDYR